MFLIAVVTLQPFAIYSGAPQSLFVLVSLLVPDDRRALALGMWGWFVSCRSSSSRW